LQTWIKNRDVNRRAKCESCIASSSWIARCRVWPQTMYPCSECQESKKPQCFETLKLRTLVDNNKAYLAVCLMCDPVKLRHQRKDKYKCNSCKEEKEITAFQREGSNLKNRNLSSWRCNSCAHPPCVSCHVVSAKPQRAPYRCMTCTYPPCAGKCGRQRPPCGKYMVTVLPVWKCASCRRQA
jgi:hypothetical protein